MSPTAQFTLPAFPTLTGTQAFHRTRIRKKEVLFIIPVPGRSCSELSSHCVGHQLATCLLTHWHCQGQRDMFCLHSFARLHSSHLGF